MSKTVTPLTAQKHSQSIRAGYILCCCHPKDDISTTYRTTVINAGVSTYILTVSTSRWLVEDITKGMTTVGRVSVDPRAEGWRRWEVNGRFLLTCEIEEDIENKTIIEKIMLAHG